MCALYFAASIFACPCFLVFLFDGVLYREAFSLAWYANSKVGRIAGHMVVLGLFLRCLPESADLCLRATTDRGIRVMERTPHVAVSRRVLENSNGHHRFLLLLLFTGLLIGPSRVSCIPGGAGNETPRDADAGRRAGERGVARCCRWSCM